MKRICRRQTPKREPKQLDQRPHGREHESDGVQSRCDNRISAHGRGQANEGWWHGNHTVIEYLFPPNLKCLFSLTACQHLSFEMNRSEGMWKLAFVCLDCLSFIILF
mgnify:CR=1 FL=1